ncbi:MAG TPA: hypothetical protein VKF38_12355 [Anaerolineaceae bacterium]|nr:hypothetical protein [Anaerolineaceae bacterium]
MALVVDQKHLDAGSTSTVGTVTDITTILRLADFNFNQAPRPPFLLPIHPTPGPASVP